MLPGSEDSVECLIFPVQLQSSSLEDLQININNTIQELSQGYIWHKEEFKVFSAICFEHTKDIPVHLTSTTSFGDNIEDEWFIVNIVLELTTRFKDVIVQIKDSDGDFLLIEAANHLPSWATPENTENRVNTSNSIHALSYLESMLSHLSHRICYLLLSSQYLKAEDQYLYCFRIDLIPLLQVFIYRGHIHLIPPNIVDLDVEIKINEALHYIVQKTEETLASPEIQNSISNRIGNYPDKFADNVHHAVVELPVGLASLLKLKPEFIAPLVTTYCQRDVIDEKACKNVNFDKSILMKVRFTKCLYAMLLHSKLIRQTKILKDNNDNKRRCLGQKLLYGYQIIMSATRDIHSSKEYQKFIKSLKDNGYFKNNIEGSQEYKKLLEQANQYYTSMECPLKTNVCLSIAETETSAEYLRLVETLQNDTTTENELEDDNEDWLKIHPDQLNDMLNTRYGKKSKFNKDDIITPQNITAELTNFLKTTSDLEGIEPGEIKNSDNNIDFDADQFANCVENMLKLISGNEDELRSEANDDFSDESMLDSDDVESDTTLDDELRAKLQGHKDNAVNNESILKNIVKSMKEEKASTGPSSNLLRTMGIQKTDLLDSDDE